MPHNESMRERDQFFHELYPHFKADKNIYVLYADVSCEGLDQYKGHPRCINMGIAEQNMVAVAAGLAADGKRVYCFTILAFYLRALEFIKVLVNSMNLPVFLVGCGKDDYYKKEGLAHVITEDKVIIGQYKNIRIWDGGDITQLVKDTLESKTPMYVRMEK